MPVGNPNDLTQRGRVFYFRRAIPCALTKRVGRSELKISLRTTELSVAKLRCRTFSNRFEQLMETVKIMPPLGKEKIEQLIRSYFSDLLSKSDEIAFLLPDDELVDVEEETASLEIELDGIRKRIATRDYDKPAITEAKNLLAPITSSGSKVSGEDFDEICNGILRARFENHRILAAILKGDYQNTEPLDPLFKGMKSPGMPPLPGEETASSAMSVSQTVTKFCNMKTKFDWSDKTHIEMKRALNWFISFMGQDRKVSTITVDDVKEFRDALLNLPASFSQSKKYKGMTFKEAAAMGTDGKTLSAGSAVKYLGGVKGFLSWCEDEGYASINPALKIKVPVKGNPNEDRYPFSNEQLELIFKSPIYTGCKSQARRSSPGDKVIRDGKFWVPLIALLTGMRMSEIIQLRVADIKEQEGVPYINVSDDASFQSIKTKSAIRVIPLHSDLVRIGFLDHVAGMREQDLHADHRIFDEIKPGANGSFSHNYSKFFGRYVGQIKAKSEKNAFHSFRHNFKDALRFAEIEDSRQDALMGHAGHGEGKTYGSKYTARMLNSDMDKIVSPVDLSHLYVKDD